MPFSIFILPQVQNWITNIKNDMDKYFWDEAICHFTIYKRFEPVMKFVVDLKIDGNSNEDIARITGKKKETVKKTLFRAKKRLKKVALKVNYT